MPSADHYKFSSGTERTLLDRNQVHVGFQLHAYHGYSFELRQYNVMSYIIQSIAIHSTAIHSTAIHSTAIHSTAIHSTAIHSTAIHSTAIHSTAIHSTAIHSTEIHSTAIHSSAIHYTIPHIILCTCYPHRQLLARKRKVATVTHGLPKWGEDFPEDVGNRFDWSILMV